MSDEKTTLIINATILRPNQRPQPGSILLHRGKLKKVSPEPSPPPPPGAKIIDACNHYVSPGLIDLHAHGGGGGHFLDDGYKHFSIILETHARFGTTALLPTLAASSYDDVLGFIRFLKPELRRKEVSRRVLGVNLEGPFLSIGKRGAQPLRFIRPPQLKELQGILEAAEGLIRIMTLAPELDGSFKLIKILRAAHVIPAIGHTTADYQTTVRAIKAGLVYATHAFNSYPPLHHRQPGAMGAVLESDQLDLEILADGVHLSPVIIRLLFRIKCPARIVLVTDANAALGKKIQRFTMGGREVKVKARAARLDDGTLVGSVVPLNQALKKLVRFAGCPLPQALAHVTLYPARILGLGEKKGDLQEGMDADLVIWNKELVAQR